MDSASLDLHSSKVFRGISLGLAGLSKFSKDTLWMSTRFPVVSIADPPVVSGHRSSSGRGVVVRLDFVLTAASLLFGLWVLQLYRVTEVLLATREKVFSSVWTSFGSCFIVVWNVCPSVVSGQRVLMATCDVLFNRWHFGVKIIVSQTSFAPTHPPGAGVSTGCTTVRDASAIPCRGALGVRAERGVWDASAIPPDKAVPGRYKGIHCLAACFSAIVFWQLSMGQLFLLKQKLLSTMKIPEMTKLFGSNTFNKLNRFHQKTD